MKVKSIKSDERFSTISEMNTTPTDGCDPCAKKAKTKAKAGKAKGACKKKPMKAKKSKCGGKEKKKRSVSMKTIIKKLDKEICELEKKRKRYEVQYKQHQKKEK